MRGQNQWTARGGLGFHEIGIDDCRGAGEWEADAYARREEIIFSNPDPMENTTQGWSISSLLSRLSSWLFGGSRKTD